VFFLFFCVWVLLLGWLVGLFVCLFVCLFLFSSLSLSLSLCVFCEGTGAFLVFTATHKRSSFRKKTGGLGLWVG
jgi:hypothetical protein